MNLKEPFKAPLLIGITISIAAVFISAYVIFVTTTKFSDISNCYSICNQYGFSFEEHYVVDYEVIDGNCLLKVKESLEGETFIIHEEKAKRMIREKISSAQK